MTPPPYTIIGTPFSTFTRSITLALTYKGLPFNQVRCVPHSDTAYDNHLFGFLPTLVIHEIDGKQVDLKLRESMAIAHFIDRVTPEPSLLISSGQGKAVIEEQMWEFASLVGAHGRLQISVRYGSYNDWFYSLGFPAVEKGVVKPRVAASDEGKFSDSEIRKQIQPGVDHLRKWLHKMEELMADDGYVFGSKLTWADFFLFPLLADLKAIPEGELLSPRLLKWMEEMNKLEAVQATTPGTLSAGARPP
jgi:glutathione S-transferase